MRSVRLETNKLKEENMKKWSDKHFLVMVAEAVTIGFIIAMAVMVLVIFA